MTKSDIATNGNLKKGRNWYNDKAYRTNNVEMKTTGRQSSEH